tara:strand:+ start:2057 stop:2503 length:447 start_codon:yes stop_codon:yes gene_type:complete
MSRILIAAQNESVSKFIKKQMKPGQYHIDTKTNSTDAWKSMNATEYDVMMIDIVMPGIDGFTMAQKALKANPGMQVIFITGFAAVAMDTYNTPTYAPRPMTSKPFHLKEITKRVGFYLGENDMPFENIYAKQDAVAQDNVIYARFGEA